MNTGKRLVGVTRRLDGYIDSAVASLERELSGIIAAAQAMTAADLRALLAVEDGRIVRSIANARAARRVEAIFAAALERAGLRGALDAFAAQFGGIMPFFQDAADILGFRVAFGVRDLAAFDFNAVAAADAVHAVIEDTAARARRRIMFSVGGLRFDDLLLALADGLKRAAPDAAGMAETGLATHYRIIADRGFKIIEAEHGPLKYLYEGPLDKLTRRFCADLRRSDKQYTRADIDRMDNGQLPNVFLTAGGWRCRHQWMVVAA